jgi:hypothetical protein
MLVTWYCIAIYLFLYSHLLQFQTHTTKRQRNWNYPIHSANFPNVATPKERWQRPREAIRVAETWPSHTGRKQMQREAASWSQTLHEATWSKARATLLAEMYSGGTPIYILVYNMVLQPIPARFSFRRPEFKSQVNLWDLRRMKWQFGRFSVCQPPIC